MSALMMWMGQQNSLTAQINSEPKRYKNSDNFVEL